MLDRGEVQDEVERLFAFEELPEDRAAEIERQRRELLEAPDMALIRGAQLAPSLVPMLKSGSLPSNRNGQCERIEWQSYRMATPCSTLTLAISPASAA